MLIIQQSPKQIADIEGPGRPEPGHGRHGRAVGGTQVARPTPGPLRQGRLIGQRVDGQPRRQLRPLGNATHVRQLGSHGLVAVAQLDCTGELYNLFC